MDTAIDKDETPQKSTAAAVFQRVTETVSGVVERRTWPKAWYIAFAISCCLVVLLGISLWHLFFTGIGIWGTNNTEGWGWAIVNFVFWVGIGHAGTLISAILFLMRQTWRTSINRSAEAMTIFAVMCAGIFPLIHVGRPWVVYWMFPLPYDMDIWPQFRSPLMWDVFAVSTYFTVSLLFWYMGMVPDLGTFRDRAKSKIKAVVFGVLSFGWRGSAKQWHRYERAYLLLAALATPLVLSVHSVVSFDFAVSQQPGWHTPIFPPYFVAGAIYSGFGMVLTLLVPARYLFGLGDIIKKSHIEAMCKVLLLTGSLVAFSYMTEFFIAWYSGNPYEGFTFFNRVFGPFQWAWGIMAFCNVVVPHFFWFKKCRTNPWIIMGLVLLVNVGMWFERFIIIVSSLTREFVPATWDYFVPTFWDAATFLGTIGMFLFLFLLFLRYLPMIAMSEVKAATPEAHADHHGTH
ncbi:MAG TPA: NrfD/PsrC family molybdoenzyme membrane anchor subunit [Kofleriaceae bacterium]|nr:NrfD/PsrC family molybdoenzyme membrane anchor subunit [Kofleriaceae bacterium]